MKQWVVMAVGAALIATLAAVGLREWIKAERRDAVASERRARMADAIDLIRTTDKALGVARKASNADLCRGMGGKTLEGVCG